MFQHFKQMGDQIRPIDRLEEILIVPIRFNGFFEHRNTSISLLTMFNRV